MARGRGAEGGARHRCCRPGAESGSSHGAQKEGPDQDTWSWQGMVCGPSRMLLWDSPQAEKITCCGRRVEPSTEVLVPEDRPPGKIACEGASCS